MTRRRAWLPFTLFAVIALVALSVSGLRGGVIRAFALGVPNSKTVAVVGPHKRVCEGPINSPEAFQSVVLWGRYVGGKPLVRIWNESSGHPKLIAAGPVEPSPPGVPGSYAAMLTTAVDRGVPVSVCVVDAGGHLKLQGSSPSYGGVVVAGAKSRVAFSLVLLDSQKHSFLGSLSLAFSRASLFRPSWVGPWTFWVLLILLLGAVPLGALAIAAAIRADEQRDD
jgi:hypothetical protein